MCAAKQNNNTCRKLEMLCNIVYFSLIILIPWKNHSKRGKGREVNVHASTVMVRTVIRVILSVWGKFSVIRHCSFMVFGSLIMYAALLHCLLAC